MIEPCPAGCEDRMVFQRVGGPHDHPHEVWKCPECGRERVRPYNRRYQ